MAGLCPFSISDAKANDEDEVVNEADDNDEVVDSDDPDDSDDPFIPEEISKTMPSTVIPGPKENAMPVEISLFFFIVVVAVDADTTSAAMACSTNGSETLNIFP